MYGKIFETTFTGSMMGAGADVFAVWSYAIANVRPCKDNTVGVVELNPALLSALIGITTDRAEAAIKFLEAPDPYSRSQIEEGRRVVREGQFLYRIVNYSEYRKVRDAEERREYQREWDRIKRKRPTKLSESDTVRHDPTNPTKAEAEAEVYTYIGDAKFKELWEAFLLMRHSIKAKPTKKAIELLMKKLHAWPLSVACEMLERSIENNWRGVFPLKGGAHGKRKSVVKEWCQERGIDLGGVQQGDGDIRGLFPEVPARDE